MKDTMRKRLDKKESGGREYEGSSRVRWIGCVGYVEILPGSRRAYPHLPYYR